MSALIRASSGQGDGAQLNDIELRATAGLVLAAGFETTVNLLGNGIRMFARYLVQRGVVSGDEIVWFWIGSHDDYERLLAER